MWGVWLIETNNIVFLHSEEEAMDFSPWGWIFDLKLDNSREQFLLKVAEETLRAKGKHYGK